VELDPDWLSEQLRCQVTTDFAITVETAEFCGAMFTDSYSVLYQEGNELAWGLSPEDNVSRPPRDYRDLGKESLVWRCASVGDANLSIGRLFRHPGTAYPVKNPVLAVLADPRTMTGIRFAMVESGAAGQRQLAEFDSIAGRFLNVRSLPTTDWRGRQARAQDPSMVSMRQILPSERELAALRRSQSARSVVFEREWLRPVAAAVA